MAAGSRQWYIFAVIFLIISCEADLNKVKEVTFREGGPDEIAENVEMLYSDSGIVRFKLMAPLLHRYLERRDSVYAEFPSGINVLFFDSAGGEDTRLSAGFAFYREKSDFLDATKNVIVTNRLGETLNTEHLWWQKKLRKIFSDEFVKITTKEETIYGTGLEATEDFTKYKILNIKGTISYRDQ